ncbi:helix-turn-helix domain-containing protein [Paucisalibacillus globulus]|uniref:helix-turn-helix domain-containing protein n=1 Tax=Paucisalibacillus globulus TaxID=351095 RepID=UPI000403C860|nr:helix-turn-helix transcriptional regulator [Paucisalibacillus globulus]
MLNSQLIGSYISKLRKEQDLTQVELADKLNVSHQAVSKWEKGDSIPDVGTLVLLADEFNISVDGILNGGKKDDKSFKNVGPIVYSIAKKDTNKAAELLNKGDSGLDDLISIAPVLKTSSLDSVTKNLDDTKLSIQHIVQLAPFLSENSLEELFNKFTNDDSYSIKDIIHLAPFLKSELISKLLMKKRDLLSIGDIAQLGPFIGEDMDEIIKDIPLKDIRWEFIMGLAPFVSIDVLKSLVDKALDKEISFNKIIAVAPFLDQDTTDELALRISNQKAESHHLSALAPFVSKYTLGEIAKSVDIDDHTLIAIAPFLGQKELGTLIEDSNLDGLAPGTIANLAPFLNQESLVKIITKIKS